MELLFKLAECNINIGNLEESINYLENIISLSRNIELTDSILNLKYRTRMLLAATVINIGDYTKVIVS